MFGLGKTSYNPPLLPGDHRFAPTILTSLWRPVCISLSKTPVTESFRAATVILVPVPETAVTLL